MAIHSAKMILVVWGQQCEITVYQKSKSVWIASGDYMGESIQTKGSSERAAAAHWRDAAHYKGNDTAPKPERPQDPSSLPQPRASEPKPAKDRDEIISGDIRIRFVKPEK
jgi:hypothetical protein